MIRIVFFGSFQHYSAKILQALIDAPDIEVAGVVTTPPMPVGRKQTITKTPVHTLAEKYQVPVYTPDVLDDAAMRRSGEAPDFFVTAGYGKMLPSEWLEMPTRGSLNLHFSLLPKYRGANPAEWAIMCGETETGITLMEMSEGLDKGAIIEQAAIPIEETDTRETLYETLYSLGAEKLPDWLRREAQGAGRRVEQPPLSPTPYAALLKREDGFIPWKVLQGESWKWEEIPSKKLQRALQHIGQLDSETVRQLDGGKLQPTVQLSNQLIGQFLYRLSRALYGYPSLWTIVPTAKGDKRMKILSFVRANGHSPLQPEWVQIEGKEPALWNQVKNLIT